MSKDPAVLWYTSDFLTGTGHFTDEELGFYVRLLAYQHQQGHLSEDFIKRLGGNRFNKKWSIVKSKFIVDGNGCFYNERMDKEIEKRKDHSNKQRDNVLKRWNKNGKGSGITVVIPLENEIENESTKGGVGETKGLQIHARNGLGPEMILVWKKTFPHYPDDSDADLTACVKIVDKVRRFLNITSVEAFGSKKEIILNYWVRVIGFISTDSWYRKKSLTQIAKEWQSLMMAFEVEQPKQDNEQGRKKLDENYERIMGRE